MAKFPSKGNSLWWESATKRRAYQCLKQDLEIDVAIIGAGIAGLTLAYLLKKQGRKVAVFEKYTIGEGVTGFTTGKVTSQHGVLYADLVKKKGFETAKLYADANQAAIKQIETIIKEEGIDCGWRREDSFVYSDKPDEREVLKNEAKVAASLGLPASYERSVTLKKGAKGAVRFKRQATFHVVDYLHGLAKVVSGRGSYVFERSKASHFKDGKRPSFRVRGATVQANEVIFATNIPARIIDHLLYGFFAYPNRSYIVAGPTKRTVKGMYINTGHPTHSVLPAKIGKQKTLLVGGYGHFTGLSGPASNHYKKLEALAHAFGVTEVTHRWSTWDFTTYDELPMAGKLHAYSKHFYVATGFRKWGLTNGTAAAMILADMLTDKENPWAPAYRPHRFAAILRMPVALVKALRFNK